MRTNDEFKEEVLKRSTQYKKRRNRKIKQLSIITCFILFGSFSSTHFISSLNNEKYSSSEQVNHQSKNEYVFKNEENIEIIEAQLNTYKWTNEEIYFIGDEIKIVLDQSYEIIVVDNKIMVDNQWSTLGDEEIAQFKELIIKLYEEE